MAEIPEVLKMWYQKRVEEIHLRVTAYDVLRHNGVDIKQNADDRAEQISCPFHGADEDPSCRVYPASGFDEPSHVWCFVCQEPHWDAIGLWRKFNGGFENCTFSQALKGIEEAYHIETPPPPDAKGYAKALREQEKAKADAKAMDGFKKIYLAAEHRLLACKPSYQHMNDLSGYLAAGSALDKIRFRVEEKLWSPEKGSESLENLLERISGRVRDCPVG